MSQWLNRLQSEHSLLYMSKSMHSLYRLSAHIQCFLQLFISYCTYRPGAQLHLGLLECLLCFGIFSPTGQLFLFLITQNLIMFQLFVSTFLFTVVMFRGSIPNSALQTVKSTLFIVLSAGLWLDVLHNLAILLYLSTALFLSNLLTSS